MHFVSKCNAIQITFSIFSAISSTSRTSGVLCLTVEKLLLFNHMTASDSVCDLSALYLCVIIDITSFFWTKIGQVVLNRELI